MKNVFVKLCICTMLLLPLVLTASCNSQKDDSPIANPIEITISIDYPDKAELTDVEESFKIEENSTVLDAIQLYCNVNEIALTVETTDGSVNGINGVENNELYTNRTWQFTVNGTVSEEPANTVFLGNGDQLQWVYKK